MKEVDNQTIFNEENDKIKQLEESNTLLKLEIEQQNKKISSLKKEKRKYK